MSEPTPSLTDSRHPDLRIVPMGMLLSHELHDEQRAGPLIRRLREEGVLRNPPVVTPAGAREDHFVILDGANRVVALDVLGIGHVLVQVVPYEPPVVELRTWFHIVSHADPTDLAGRLRGIPGVISEAADIYHARALLAGRTVLAYFMLPDGAVITLGGGGLDYERRTELLRRIAESYLDTGTLNRASTDDLSTLLTLYPEMAVAIVYPRYDPAEILDLASQGLMVPPGITRHVINGRALRLDYPIERLTADVPLEVKNKELSRWIQQKFEQREVRYYAESTYLFDE